MLVPTRLSTRPTTRLRRSLLLGGGALATAVLAACSSGGYSSPAAPAAPSSTTSAAGGAVRVTTHHGTLGTWLTDASGRTLYEFAADSATASRCTGSCAGYWPPVTTTGTPSAAGEVRAADLGTIARPDGTRQVTYAGHPLYRYVGDQHPGDATGQGSTLSGALWWVLAPSGTPITAGGAASSGSGGYGG